MDASPSSSQPGSLRPLRRNPIMAEPSPNSGVSTPNLASSTSSSNPSPPSRLPRLPPFLFSYRESVGLAVFPTLLLFGMLFSVISPSGPELGFDAAASDFSSSQPPPPNYFARKNNVFNVYFVKRGWLWISLSFFAFVATHPAFDGNSNSNSSNKRTTNPSPSHFLLGRRLSAVVRWSLVTLWWFLVTQWFFGPPLIDRSFRLTGGSCQVRDVSSSSLHVAASELSTMTAAAACKRVGGHWHGGHDISGHVFMLMLGSVFLVQEVGWVWLRGTRTGSGTAKTKIQAGRLDDERTIVMADGAVKTVELEADGDVLSMGASRDASPSSVWAVRFVGVVVGLSLWMLLMTAIYFHTWLEKLTGLLVAVAGIYAVYVLPRLLPAMRQLVGMPGL